VTRHAGISATSARALLARFGNLAGVLAAGRDEWLTVPGIGPERAALLRRRSESRSVLSTHSGSPQPHRISRAAATTTTWFAQVGYSLCCPSCGIA